ncbi:hypothetical protein FRC18_005245 [Serendipita sp. 400]|nr:hypothetical protein FRC18_005245 [Serendipita sp. 400]
MRHRIEEGGEIRDSSMDDLRCSLLTELTYLNQLGKAGYHTSKLHSLLLLSSSFVLSAWCPFGTYCPQTIYDESADILSTFCPPDSILTSVTCLLGEYSRNYASFHRVCSPLLLDGRDSRADGTGP